MEPRLVAAEIPEQFNAGEPAVFASMEPRLVAAEIAAARSLANRPVHTSIEPRLVAAEINGRYRPDSEISTSTHTPRGVFTKIVITDCADRLIVPAIVGGMARQRWRA